MKGGSRAFSSRALHPTNIPNPRRRRLVEEPIIGTVLLVEDNEKVAEITAALLQELGCRTKRARNADEALEIFTNGGIDLVLIDIVMPGGVNGLDLARNLRDQLPVLPKPYRRGRLVETISNLLAAGPQPINDPSPFLTQ